MIYLMFILKIKSVTLIAQFLQLHLRRSIQKG